MQDTITCPRGCKVDIISATYGRTSPTLCEHEKMSNTSCDSTADITGILQNHCASQAGTSSCIVTPTNAFFDDDPCEGTYKYLTVNYNCGKLNDSSLYIVTSLFLIRPAQVKRCPRTCAKCTKYHLGLCSPFMYPELSNDSVNGQYRPWSDCANAQANLGFPCPNMSKEKNSMMWSIWILIHACAFQRKFLVPANTQRRNNVVHDGATTL